MANFSGKILGNSISSLLAHQALIANSSNNIANVNTPGYTRRELSLNNRADAEKIPASLSFGSGVEVASIKRITNTFLETAVRDALSRQGMSNVANDYLGRIESLFSLTGPQLTIGSSLNEFFASVNALAVNPSSLDDRLTLLERGQDLVTAIKTTYNTIAAAQTELDTRVPMEVEEVNTLATQIAELNGIIYMRQGSNIPAPDELDQRNALLQKLAEKITFQSLELENGMMNISLTNGFPLVHEVTSRALSVTTTPSFGEGLTLPPSLEGRTLSYIVYNYGSETNPSHLDLTKTIKNGMGTLGGVLQLRGYADVTNASAFDADGELVAIAARVEALTRGLLTDVNEIYLGPDEDSSTSGHQASSGDLNGLPPDVFGLFDFDYSGIKDADLDGIPSMSDLVASELPNFSSRLRLSITTPERFAAALDNDATEGSTEFPPGDGQNAAIIANMKTSQITFSAGGFLMVGTFDELYSSTVNYVGGQKARAESDVNVANATQVSAQARRDQLSAVSLDEEFANLVRFQKAFQASARMIRTANEMLEEIVTLL